MKLALFLLIAATGQGHPAPAPVPDLGRPPTAVVASDHPGGPVAPGTLVTLDASGSIGQLGYWYTEADPAAYRVDTGGRHVHFASAAPGSYRFTYISFGKNAGTLQAASTSAVIGVSAPAAAPRSPAPAATPQAPPIPPAPAAAPGRLHATLVFDLDDPSTAHLRVSDIKDRLAALDCAWSVAQPSSPVAKMLSAQGGTPRVPTVYLSDDAGTVRDVIHAPNAPDDVVDRVRSLRGAP